MQFRVVKSLHLKDFDELVFLHSGAVYIEGDIIDVNANEASELMLISPQNFKPLDDMAEAVTAQQASVHNVVVSGELPVSDESWPDGGNPPTSREMDE